MRIITRPIVRWPGKLLDDDERQPHRFDTGWTATRRLLLDEARHLGAEEVVLQLGIREQDLRLDGEPRANARPPAHPGVIVSIEGDQGPLSFPCDTFRRRGYRDPLEGWQANVRAVALAMEALRKVDRYGITRNGEQYVGWKAIEAGDGGATSAEAAAELLLRAAFTDDAAFALKGVAAHIDEVIDDPDYRSRIYKRAAMATHPDHGGDADDFRNVQLALEVLARGDT